MIITLNGLFGSNISLDLRHQLGESVELECFQFVQPPIEFRLVRNSNPLQDWQAGNTAVYDLQHGPNVQQWARDDHWFINDLAHQGDIVTCGVLSTNLAVETRGLGLTFVLLVWPRESTVRRVLTTLK
ncbi:MAG TPA: hypothetical protein VFK06_17790 [Candidatus Angelobacter sp.]|nr:hypothetical protein [Candidatus Angelobacter sp.]